MFECKACRALREQIEDLKAERNYFRQQVLDRLSPVPQRQERSAREQTPVQMPLSGWPSMRAKLEKKFSKKPEDAKAKYWEDRVKDLEREAGLPHKSEIQEELEKDASSVG
jgi:hypothetical protein